MFERFKPIRSAYWESVKVVADFNSVNVVDETIEVRFGSRIRARIRIARSLFDPVTSLLATCTSGVLLNLR